MSRKPRLPTLAFGLSPIRTECQRQFGVQPVYARIKFREMGSRARGSFYASFHIDGSLSQLEQDFVEGRKQLGFHDDKKFETWIQMMFTPFIARDFVSTSMDLIAGWQRHDDIVTVSHPHNNVGFQRECSWYIPRSVADGAHLEGII